MTARFNALLVLGLALTWAATPTPAAEEEAKEAPKPKSDTPKAVLVSLAKAIEDGDSATASACVDQSSADGKQAAALMGTLASMYQNTRTLRTVAIEKYGEEAVNQEMSVDEIEKLNPLRTLLDDPDAVETQKDGDKATATLKRDEEAAAERGPIRMDKPIHLTKTADGWRLSALPGSDEMPGGLELVNKMMGAMNELMVDAVGIVDAQDTFAGFEQAMERKAQEKMQPIMQEIMMKAMQQGTQPQEHGVEGGQ